MADISEDNFRAPTTQLSFNRIVIIGGGCYGSWYTGQLSRAMSRGALIAREIVVVDRNPDCKVARLQAVGEYAVLPLRIEHSEWSNYLESWLSTEISELTNDAMVPSPLMPHLCLDWLMARATRRWPDRQIRVSPLPRDVGLPWERASPDNRHYVSFATWMCPVNCIEPARCPHTRGPRDWSLPVAVDAYVKRLQRDDSIVHSSTLRGPVIFHCTHRTYGVGMIDAAPIVRADADVASWGTAGEIAVLVGTTSHCHGALGLLEISDGPRNSRER